MAEIDYDARYFAEYLELGITVKDFVEYLYEVHVEPKSEML